MLLLLPIVLAVVVVVVVVVVVAVVVVDVVVLVLVLVFVLTFVVGGGGGAWCLFSFLKMSLVVTNQWEAILVVCRLHAHLGCSRSHHTLCPRYC